MTGAGGVIQARGYSWRHASRDGFALTDVDLDVAPGERILLTGDSGAGKSTLLAAIADLLGDEEDGESRGAMSVSGTVGMVLQDPDSQVIASRVGDDVAFGCENLGLPREEIWRRVPAALEMVGLNLPLNHPTRQLSGGQKQRLVLAGVIAMGAQIILLDEPTANLDPDGRREIVEAVDRVVSLTDATLIIAEHRAHHWAPVVDRFLHLGSGGLAEITADDLPAPPSLPPARRVPADTPVVLEARDLLTEWGPPRTLTLAAGTSTVLTGANGSGKSTLALTLAGLAKPRGGVLDYAPSLRQGLPGPAHTWSSAQLAQRIGVVFQDPEHQFVARTVAGEMAVGGGDRARIDELLERLRLAHLTEANPFTLSGGEKRRLSVATALVNAPGLLILDEPTFGQDDRTFVELVTLLRELADEGVTIASITHDESFIASLGDREVTVT